jgi:hypothetical protein
VKNTVIILGILGLAWPAANALAAVEMAALDQGSNQMETVPLMEWDEPDELAQQQPEPTLPQPIPAPVTPPAPAAVTPPAPAPVTPPAPATPQTQPAPVPPPATPPPAVTPPEAVPLPGDAAEPVDPENAPADGANEEDLSLGDIPIVETIELTPDSAKKALDTYLLVREKYKDAELENYENLQDFVDQAPQGKAFEADVKAAGFPNVTDWNTAVTTLSFAYDNSVNDQTADTKKQIEELEKDTETAKDMRDRMIKALQAMIPSDNNKKVVEEMKADAAYGEKLKILETETE